jgi:hypothetical protein
MLSHINAINEHVHHVMMSNFLKKMNMYIMTDDVKFFKKMNMYIMMDDVNFFYKNEHVHHDG